MKKLLVVVDYQKDFVDGSLGFAGAEQLEGPICEKIEAYARSGGDVVFTFDTHEDDYLNTQEGKKLPVPHCILGSEGWQLYGRVRALSVGRTLFFKKTFGCGELYDYLQAHPEYESVELVGLVSNICVMANAILAKTALPEAEILVDSACTAGADAALHQKALDVLRGLQVTVL